MRLYSLAGGFLCFCLAASSQSASVASLLRNGNQCLEARQFREAEIAFRQALAQEPDSPEALEDLALLQLFMGRQIAAGETAAHLVRVDQQSYNGRLISGLVLLNQSSFRESERVLKPLLNEQDFDPLVGAMLAEDYKALKQRTEEARMQRLLSSTRVQPKDAILAAQIFTVGPARGYVARWLSALLAQDSSNTPIRLLLGNAYRASGRWQDAQQCLFPLISALDPDLSAILAYATVEDQLGQQREAIHALEKAQHLPKRTLAEYLQWASACTSRKMYVDARKALETAVAQFPNSSEAHYQLGIVLQYLDDGAAEQQLQRALELDPSHLPARLALAFLYFHSGRESAAQMECEATRSQDSTNSAAHLCLGVCLRQKGETRRAAEEFKSAIRLNPDEETAYSELGKTEIALNDSAAAEGAYRQAILLNPQDWRAHYGLGMLLRSKEPPAAKRELALSQHLKSQTQALLVLY